jgi:signal transduction histidine kinase
MPIRARLTAAFALAMVLMLAVAGSFVYLRLRADLDDAVDTALHARADAIAVPAGRPGPVLTDPGPAAAEETEEGFVQVLSPQGRVLDRAGGPHAPVPRASELARAADGGVVVVERQVAGIEGTARVLARPASERAGAPIVVVGQSLDDRDETLAGLVTSFAVGGPLAVVAASLIGYALAAAGLAPVEAMRHRAELVSLADDRGERLPLPRAHDEVRRLGETLNEMLDRLRRSFERERRFVADASHELRTPVAIVKTELEGALLTHEYGPPVREALVAAVEECDRLALLAEDLLVIARAADEGLPVRREQVRARSLLEGLGEAYSDRAAHHGREVRVDVEEDLELSGDPLRLRQALGNLLDNALRHGDGDVVLGARRSQGGVELDVADAGRGFGGEIAARAFERFARGDEARTRGGAGLGLAIVRAIAEAHGGRAEIVPGSGAIVRVWLPDPGPGQGDGRRRSSPGAGVEPSQAGLS